MTFEPNLTESRERLDAFSEAMMQRGLWTSNGHPREDTETVSMLLHEVGAYPNNSFRIEANRFHHIGGAAIKANIWRDNFPNGEQYLGAIGIHPSAAKPYCRVTQSDYGAADLWVILDHTPAAIQPPPNKTKA